MSKGRYAHKRSDLGQTLYDIRNDVEKILDSLEQIERALETFSDELEEKQTSFDFPESRW